MASIKEIIKKPYYYVLLLYGHLIPQTLEYDKKYLKKMYKYLMKKELNIDNPQTFNEKLQWLKLYDRKDIYTKMVDKYEVKKYVANIIGEEYIIPTLGVWDRFDDIDFDKLPNQFVLKCTHDSGGIVIIKEKNRMNNNKIKKKINHCLKRNFYYNSREYPYKNIIPRIIAEPYLEDSKYHELRDYKFFMFNNKLALFFICSERNKNVKFTFFDKNKRFLNINQCGAENDPNVELPKNINKMIDFSNRLSKDITQVRVDFYEVDGKLYFGELTFFDSGGFGYFSPSEWDLKIGNMLKVGENHEK